MDFRGNRKNVEKLKKKKPGWLLYVLALLILIVIAGAVAIHFSTRFLWMESLGFSGVFTTILWSKISLAGAGFLLFAGAMFITLFLIYRTYFKALSAGKLPPFFFSRKIMMLMIAAISVVVGLFGSSAAQGFGWERLLKFINRTSFGQADPYFHFDISFYVFVLPFLKFILALLIGLVIFLLIIEGLAYSVFSLYRQDRRAQIHLGVTLGFLGLFVACQHLLAPFETLLTNHVNVFQKSTVYGLSYTDHLINIPKDYIMAAVAVIGIVWIIVSFIRGSFRGMVTPIIFYIGLAIVGQLASAAVQQFVVSPNEFSKEKPYLQHNLDFTKTAYGLNDMKEMKHPGNLSLSKDMLDRNKQTINNIRINDVRPLLSVYNQLQTFRTYYQFNDVDIDRYMVNGKYQQVFVGARELSTGDLPSQAHTWVNQNLRYTHGYGVTMSHVNKISNQGQPEYMVKNLPPKGDVDVNKPQVYFGEEDYDSVIVNSKVDEFDYPSGEENKNSHYKANAGIPLKGINRLLFAIKEKDPRIFVSDQVTSKSQLLETRNIKDRLNRIAPFLSYDEDPYIVVRDDGSLTWVVDAYVKAKNYPYSEPYDGNTDYMRNPVKVAVDAYTGKVKFYAVEDDPLLETYRKMFPSMFSDDVPKDLKAHFRYPVNLFNVQASMYRTYHMSNLEIFYNREDYWEFPTEKYFNEDITMEPYYITMKLPEADKEEFILMMPYTPKNKQNMIAWIGVRNDGKHYGEKFVYRFPKQKNVYGPQQIENRINQNSDISKQINLWSQGGSKVIRGNQLVIPIEDTVLYVEPLYIESSNRTSLPEVKRIIVSYGDQIVMDPTLDGALDHLVKLIDPDEKQKESKKDEGKEKKPDKPKKSPKSEKKLKQLSDLFNQYKKAVSQGNWEKSGEIMKKIEKMLGK